MASNSIFYRMLNDPWVYRWVVAMVLPFLIWAVLVKLSQKSSGNSAPKSSMAEGISLG